MKWADYAYQPIGHVLRPLPVARPESWLASVNAHGVLRVPDAEPPAGGRRAESLEAAVGQYFRPDAEISLEVLQVAGLLLKANRLDRLACARSARRHGGGLYFKWFLAQIDDSLADPLPAKEFPLHRSRWRKRRAGQRGRHAQ